MGRRRRLLTTVWLVLSIGQINAQLNHSEKIILDSVSVYPHHGFEFDGGYVVGGAENSCHIATVWKMDESFRRVQTKQLIHDSYEISAMYDMTKNDSVIEVMSWQLQTEDVTSAEGIKWYAVDPVDLTILDSLYIPELHSKDGLFLDSLWVVHTRDDTLLFISPVDGRTVHKQPFSTGPNHLTAAPSGVASWRDSMVFLIDSAYRVDTFYFDHQVLDVVTNSNALYVLTTDSVWAINSPHTGFIFRAEKAPEGARALLFQPFVPALVVFTTSNTCVYLDLNTLTPVQEVQLYYNEFHQEDVNYVALDDGSILRLGTTRVKGRRRGSIRYGQVMGFFHRFNEEYTEGGILRSDLKLKEVSIRDDYYGTKPNLILGDSAYFISADSDTRISWKFENVGHDQVGSGLTATNRLFAFNCTEGYYTQILDDIFSPGGSGGEGFNYQKQDDLTVGHEEKVLVYTAYPNGHYDADFSDNYQFFTFRYVLSDALQELRADELYIYPNPAGERVYISTTNGAGIQSSRLLTIDGALVAKMQPDKPTAEIELPINNLLPGVYILRVHTSKGTTVKKLLITR